MNDKLINESILPAEDVLSPDKPVKYPVSRKVFNWIMDKASVRSKITRNKFDAGNEENLFTVDELVEISNAVAVPFWYFFFKEPFNTVLGNGVGYRLEYINIPKSAKVKLKNVDNFKRYNTSLLCSHRHKWYMDYALKKDIKSKAYEKKAMITEHWSNVAEDIINTLGLETKEKEFSSCLELFQHLKTKVEEAGILLMFDFVVDFDKKKKLTIKKDFLGLSITDDKNIAPVIFINSQACIKSQTFTISHELAHIWLKYEKSKQMESNDNEIDKIEDMGRIEDWCNKVAARILFPKINLEKFLDENPDIKERTLRFDELNKLIDNLADKRKICRGIIVKRLLERNYIVTQDIADKLYSSPIEFFFKSNHLQEKIKSPKHIINNNGKLFLKAVLSEENNNVDPSTFEYLTGIPYDDKKKIISVKKILEQR